MIEVRDLVVRRAGRVICAHAALDVAAGERVGILGSNGSGKSTLLKALAGFEPDAEGAARVAVARSERVYVHQAPYLLRGSVLSNVAYGLRMRGMGRRERVARARAMCERLGIGALVDRRARGLSGGEVRRVALARALVLEPRVLLLDEPLADLDTDAAARVHEALRELPACTVLISSPVPLPAGWVERSIELRTPSHASPASS